MEKFKSISSWVLIVAGCMMLATFGIVRWTEQQVLDTDNWVKTVSVLPQDPAVARSIGGQIVDRMFEGSDVSGDIREVLPPKLVFLAPAISNFLRDKADELATNLIMSDRFTQLWTTANRTAHEKLVEVLRKPAIKGDNTQVLPYKINLAQAQQWLQTAAEKSDNPGLLNAAATADKAETFNASLRSGLSQMRTFVRASDVLYALLPYAIIASFLGALALAKRQYKALMAICTGVVAVNLMAIVGVNFVRPALLNMLENQAYQPIFNSLWNSLMPPFLEFARSMVAVAAAVMLVAFLWHKRVFSRMVPARLERLNWYKTSIKFVVATRSSAIELRRYLYGVPTGLAVLYLAFVPDQTPLEVARIVFMLIIFFGFVGILTRSPSEGK